MPESNRTPPNRRPPAHPGRPDRSHAQRTAAVQLALQRRHRHLVPRHLDLPVRLFRLAAALLGAVLLAGCTVLPPRPPTSATYAHADVRDTQLARALATPADQHGLSGFLLLPEGGNAFGARVALARRAHKSIDAQYFLVNNDGTGRQLLRELRDAALRGVRVRLLVDDLFAGGEDELLAGLAAYPNAEVRIFNPLPVRTGPLVARILLSLHQFDRINRRMHNKLFIADNSMAVLGGRNVADEYFDRSATANFIDLDVAATGPVVRELSAVFDRYWNSEYAYPISAVTAVAAPSADARARFDRLVRDAAPQVGAGASEALGQAPFARQLDSGTLDLMYASARVVADSPDKVAKTGAAHLGDTVTEQILVLFDAAHDSVDIVTPYFIPGTRGLAMMKNGIGRGGRVSLVTNSLGATDVPLVYEYYSRYRLAMLRAGVEIHEVSPSLARRAAGVGRFGSSYARLHAKVGVIDRRLVFIGSMNLDPRSAFSNTELVLVIDSPQMVQVITPLLRKTLVSNSYRLRLSPDGERAQWLETQADGRIVVHDATPEASGWQRLRLSLLSRFVDEGLL